jgi:hypothetical protein
MADLSSDKSGPEDDSDEGFCREFDDVDYDERTAQIQTPREQAQVEANATMKRTRPRTSINPKTIQATNLRAQKKLVGLAQATGEDALIESALQFPVGQVAYPRLHAIASSATEN